LWIWQYYLLRNLPANKRMSAPKSNPVFWFFLATTRLCRCHEINTMLELEEDSLGDNFLRRPIEYQSPRRIRKRFVVFDTDNLQSFNQDALTHKVMNNKWNDEHLNHRDFHGNRSRGSKNQNNTKSQDHKFAHYRTLTIAKEEEMNKKRVKKNGHVKGSELDSEVLDYVIRNSDLQQSYPPLSVPTYRPSSSAQLPTATPLDESNNPTLTMTSTEPTISVGDSPTVNPEYKTEEPTSLTPTTFGSSLEPYTNKPSSTGNAMIKPTISPVDDVKALPTSSPTSDTTKGVTESPTSPPTTAATDENTAIPTFLPTPLSLSFFPTYSGTYSPTFSTYYPTYGTYAPTLEGTYEPTLSQVDNLPSSNRFCPSNLARSEVLRDDLTLYYEFIHDEAKDSGNGGVLCVRLEYDSQGWLGFGFSSGGEMVGSTAVIGLPNYKDSVANPGKYSLDGKTDSLVVPMDAAQQTLRDATIRQDNGMTMMEFGKLMIEDDEEPLVVPGENTFIYSASANNELGYHGFKRGSITVYLE